MASRKEPRADETLLQSRQRLFAARTYYPAAKLEAAPLASPIELTATSGNTHQILFVDNFDSFSFNLVHQLLSLAAQVRVVANDDRPALESAKKWCTHIVVSPGPGRPNEAGLAPDLVQELLNGELDRPFLGVCLGHQMLCELAGAQLRCAAFPRHGKPSPITHEGDGIFHNLPSPTTAMRYHSLAIAAETLPEELSACAWSEDGELMGVRHTTRPIYGVQFHPESVGTSHGLELLANFLRAQAL